MSPLENQNLADIPAGIYQDMEEQLMANIVRHCKDYGQPIASDRWLLVKLAEIGKLNKENIKIIAKLSGSLQTAMEQMLMETVELALEEVEQGFAELSRQNLIGETVDIGQSENVKQVMEGMTKRTKDTRNLCNTNMLYKARDAYQGLVQKVASAAEEIANKQEYLDVMNKHTSTVVIGAESRQQAMRKCIREFNDKGIPAFIDKRGREWTPEAYVNMTMRATAKNAADEVQTARCVDFGIDLISIDTHSGSRPKCAKDQGKIFSLNNSSGYTEDLNGKKIPYFPWNSSSYGQPDGILGINCGHHKFPFIPKVNIHRYFPTEDFKENDRLYKETQVQRALERDVRKQKRECMLFDQIEDKEAFKEAAVKLKSKEAKLKYYVDSKKHLNRRKDREEVVGFDKRIAAEASGKAQTHYKEWAKSIGAESGPKSLAGYYDLKYNDNNESRLYKGYVNAVKKGNISPLMGYDNFKEVSDKAEQQLTGLSTADGKKVKGMTAHFVDRVIGQHSAADSGKPGLRRGVQLDDIEDALKNPRKIGEVKTQKDGKKSMVYYGNSANVSMNPDTGELIQTEGS